jgi:hypothetical protein
MISFSLFQDICVSIDLSSNNNNDNIRIPVKTFHLLQSHHHDDDAVADGGFIATITWIINYVRAFIIIIIRLVSFLGFIFSFSLFLIFFSVKHDDENQKFCKTENLT